MRNICSGITCLVQQHHTPFFIFHQHERETKACALRLIVVVVVNVSEGRERERERERPRRRLSAMFWCSLVYWQITCHPVIYLKVIFCKYIKPCYSIFSATGEISFHHGDTVTHCVNLMCLSNTFTHLFASSIQEASALSIWDAKSNFEGVMLMQLANKLLQRSAQVLLLMWWSHNDISNSTLFPP